MAERGQKISDSPRTMIPFNHSVILTKQINKTNSARQPRTCSSIQMLMSNDQGTRPSCLGSNFFFYGSLSEENNRREKISV